MLRRLTRLTVPVVALTTGYAFFPKEWRKNHSSELKKINHFNESINDQLELSKEFQELSSNDKIRKFSPRQEFPSQHRENYVGSGILFGPDLMEIDPIVFINPDEGELTSFYHLGTKLISQDGQIHNGIVSTILDEGLCTCGFARLPSKKGVTAKLSINFINQAPPNSTVVLRAKVVESKGRKVIIRGDLETYPLNGGEAVKIATSECILVEPKWFKYLSWLQVF
ncbi:MIOREX complex component 3 [[Candida] anglica]|uniref:MIOREX complex component 3 n=1 Tax=[Candida] anglica TaxID=148631 RepID=A0ABP0EFX6_9ASCO